MLYGAERNRDDDIIRPSWVIPALNALFGILTSAVIFSYLGYVSYVGQVPFYEIKNLGIHGHSLPFVVFPAIVALMPLSNLFSIVFFGTLICNTMLLNKNSSRHRQIAILHRLFDEKHRG